MCEFSDPIGREEDLRDVVQCIAEAQYCNLSRRSADVAIGWWAVGTHT